MDIRDTFQLLCKHADIEDTVNVITLAIHYKNKGYVDRDARIALASFLTERSIGTFKDLSWPERYAMKELSDKYEQETKLAYYKCRKQLNQEETESQDNGDVWREVPLDWFTRNRPR